MSTYNDLQQLRSLDATVLAEIIREGEDRLKAQLDVATAADQRALTIAGAELTVATAAMGGGIALARGTNPDLWLASLSIIFAGALVVAAYYAIQSARPDDFNFPGNKPSAWVPSRWLGASGGKFDLAQARIEQAACVDDAIQDNKAIMARAAKKVHRSLDLALWATALVAVLSLVTVIAETWTITEPTSEIIRR